MDSTVARPVVVGIDGTPGSAGALRYAAREAMLRTCGLVLVHVWPSPALAAPAELGLAELEALGLQILEDARTEARLLAPAVDIESVLTTGGRAAAIVRAAEHAQLVVVGRETSHGLERVVRGSTAVQVGGHASCVVVAVPADWSAPDAHDHVVVGVATRDHSVELLAHAFDAAHARQARLTLVTSWALPDPYVDRIVQRTHAEDREAAGLRLLSDLASKPRADRPDVVVDFHVEHGPAAEVLLRVARDADLLVIGRRRHALPTHWWLGSTAQALLRSSSCPVELVPATSAFSSEGPDAELEVEEAGTLVR